ncbi:hypothetical protein [Listeria booriae]|uniref:hypothetical protein n=1 Tax=Listeria booriae TaxID=1552123 RepID=UPI00162ABA86|nr:hypothetical protein [Listeria booriae]MBC2389481.1 hypothetical protein [Listeria booriae]
MKIEQIEGEKTYPLFDREILAVEAGNFNGKKLVDNETYYNPPRKKDLKDGTTFKITWEKDGEVASELLDLKWKRRMFVKPLI